MKDVFSVKVDTNRILRKSPTNRRRLPDENAVVLQACKELRNNGAVLRDSLVSSFFIDLEKKGKHKSRVVSVVIDEKWKGGLQKLKYLRDLPDLREVIIKHPELTINWCREICSLRQLEGLFLNGANVNDKVLMPIRKLRHLQALSLRQTSVSDSGIKHIKTMSKLRHLCLDVTNVTDEGLAHLKGLMNLESLSLSYTKTTGKGIAYLKGLTKLRRLILSYEFVRAQQADNSGLLQLTRMKDLRILHAHQLFVSDFELSVVRNMPNLEELEVPQSCITDKGLRHLQGLSKLESLDLSKSRITCEGLNHVQHLKKLVFLNLADTTIDDRAVKYLIPLKNLRYLNLSNTKLSAAGITRLKNKRPHLLISPPRSGK
jgi:Leucine-rich repeat (LRR) protein